MFPTSPGPFPTYYYGGTQSALGVLTRSNLPGKHEAKKNVLFARKAMSLHANIYMSSASGGATSQVIRSDKRLKFMDIYPTDSDWFTGFMTDLRSRIVEHINQDAVISIALMIKMQRLFE